jgi:ABC-2 type transport system ATP-binding protein
VVAGLRELGKTVFLTTHYMDEAEALADRLGVIVDGEIVAEGRPAEIGGREREEAVISFELPAGVAAAELPARDLRVTGTRVELRVAHPTRDVAALAGWAVEHGLELEGLDVHRPSLEDVYLRLTGGR